MATKPKNAKAVFVWMAKQRARKLSARRRKQIASMGGQALRKKRAQEKSPDAENKP